MNLRAIKKSRQAQQPGDVFVYQINDFPGVYFWGRVIRTDAAIGGFENTTLIYLYDERSKDKIVLPKLDCSRLLVPPIATNSLPWAKGFFETVAAVELDNGDVLTQHCFRDFTGRYYDDDGNQIFSITEPVGEYGLDSYKTIDDKISEALGIRSQTP